MPIQRSISTSLTYIMKPPLQNWTRTLCKTRIINNKLYCTSPSNEIEKEKERELQRIAEKASIDEPPTACCQSGCANCVFIVWAEAVTAKMEHAGPDVVKKIMDSVEDPSMKAYLDLELRLRGLSK